MRAGTTLAPAWVAGLALCAVFAVTRSDAIAQVCSAPAEAADGHVWVFVRTDRALRSLRYATDPEVLKRVGLQAGEAEHPNVVANVCVPIQVPRVATTLYVRASGTNVDRGLTPVPTITRCRATSPVCILPLVPVSARRRVEVAAAATLPARDFETHGVDRVLLGGGRMLQRGRQLDVTSALSVIEFSGTREIFADTTIALTDDAIEFWTPPRAQYLVVPTEALSIDLDADWATLREALTWFRAGDWLLGAETDDARDSVVALVCTSEGCTARQIHGELDGAVLVDQEVATISAPPSDLAARSTDVRVEERGVSEEALVLHRGTRMVRGDRELDLTRIGPDAVHPTLRPGTEGILRRPELPPDGILRGPGPRGSRDGGGRVGPTGP